MTLAGDDPTVPAVSPLQGRSVLEKVAGAGSLVTSLDVPRKAEFCAMVTRRAKTKHVCATCPATDFFHPGVTLVMMTCAKNPPVPQCVCS